MRTAACNGLLVATLVVGGCVGARTKELSAISSGDPGEPAADADAGFEERPHPAGGAEWTFDGKHLAVETGEALDLTPIENVRADVVGLSHRKPNTMLVALNDRDESVFDLLALDLATGERRLLARNDEELFGWIFAHDLKLRFARKWRTTARWCGW